MYIFRRTFLALSGVATSAGVVDLTALVQSTPALDADFY